MADACHEVAAMLLAIVGDGDADATLDAITALLPLLEHRADEQKSNPAVRSVYAGAATRIREVRSAEAQSAHAGDAEPDDLEDDALAELDLADDTDADDDDIDDDTIVFDDDRADGAQ
jgi:DNA-binding ferritin-like protein